MITVEHIEKYLGDNGLSGGYLLKDKGQGNFIARWDHDIPVPTEEDLDIYVDAVARDKATDMHNREMRISDTEMPRYVEDIIDALEPLVRARIPKETLSNYNDKKILRANKPV